MANNTYVVLKLKPVSNGEKQTFISFYTMKLKYCCLLILGLFITISSCKKENIEMNSPLILQPDGSSGKDAVFSLIVPDNNYSTLKDIHLYAWTQEGILNVNRVVIDFDLSSIPNDAILDSAFLSLFFNKTSEYGTHHSGENGFLIQRITSVWDECRITWNNQPTTTIENQVFISKSTSPTQDYIKMNVTNLVQDMINDRTNSFGFLLKFQIEEPYKILLFASSDNQDATLRPKIIVYYKD